MCIRRLWTWGTKLTLRLLLSTTNTARSMKHATLIHFIFTSALWLVVDILNICEFKVIYLKNVVTCQIYFLRDRWINCLYTFGMLCKRQALSSHDKTIKMSAITLMLDIKIVRMHCAPKHVYQASASHKFRNSLAPEATWKREYINPSADFTISSVRPIGSAKLLLTCIRFTWQVYF